MNYAMDVPGGEHNDVCVFVSICVYTACIFVLDDSRGISSFFEESMMSLSGWKNASFFTEYDDDENNDLAHETDCCMSAVC